MTKQTFFRLTAFGTVAVIALLAAVILSASAAPVAAQAPQPPTPFDSAPPAVEPSGLPRSPRRGPGGLWYMPGEMPGRRRPGSPVDTGGPDDFGYTWDDSVPLNWVDASGGTDTGINSDTDHVGPIDVGFSFKYYENTYTQLYISRFGFVAFNDTDIYNSQSRVPSPERPNDVIAPHWVPAYAVNGYVRYRRGGSAPNRWFVVEWRRLESDCCDDAAEEYTFEVILHENGNIVFQYGTMTVNDGWWCQASGIEDSTGLDGLSITDFCDQVAPDHAVRIYRPAPSARVRVYPLYQGRFTRVGETDTFQVPIRNTGDLGSDTYDLTKTSTWPVSLYAADGTTRLTDTDGDGRVDTGPVAQGGSVTIVAKVQTPATVSMSDANTAAITVRSSLNTGKHKTAELRTAVPASFAQVYLDAADGAMSLYLVQPEAQVVKKATANDYYGFNMAATTAPGGNFVYVWTNGRCLDDCNVYVEELEYTLLDRAGNPLRPVLNLTDHSGATMDTYDWSSAVAVAPNGRIGVVWAREWWRERDGERQFNSNVYFAVLDAAGNLAYGPRNLTNNTVWGSWGDYNFPYFYQPVIAATDDNRFVLSWTLEYQTPPDGGCSESCWVNNIYYAVRGANGTGVKPITRFTNDTPGWEEMHDDSNLARLRGRRVLLSWECHRDPDYRADICYAVLDSAGNIVKRITNASGTRESSFNVDAAELSSGNIVIAWHEWQGDLYRIAYSVLDSAYNRIVGPAVLDNPAAVTGDYSPSVTTDTAGHAVLSWMDANWNYRRNLYYALVGGNGDVLTRPTIFRTSQATVPYIETSYIGYGNTSYTATAPARPSISIYTDKESYATGETQQVGLDLANPGSAQPVRFLILLWGPWGQAIPIIDVNFTLPAGFELSKPDLFAWTLPATLPAGTYAWIGALVPAGGEPIVDTAVWTVAGGASSRDQVPVEVLKAFEDIGFNFEKYDGGP